MTVRKPQEQNWDSFIEEQIRAARDEGQFRNLPGAGKPIPDLDRPHDELWWVKDKLRREGLTGLLPEALEIRRDVERALEALPKAHDEQQLRRMLAVLNVKIRKLNATTTSGPPTTLAPLDVEAIVRRWRRAGHR